MKQLMLMFAIVAALSLFAASAQDSRPASDGASIDSAIAALYDVISGPPGPRDWDRFRNLFAEDGKLISTGLNREGVFQMRQMSPEGYIEGSGKWLESNGFFEIEIARKLERFGPIAHAFCTYETRREEGGELRGRGINSIQLVNDGENWRILSIFWTNERDETPIPEQYLP